MEVIGLSECDQITTQGMDKLDLGYGGGQIILKARKHFGSDAPAWTY